MSSTLELHGVGVSEGIALGPALLIEREAMPVLRLLLPEEAVEAELQRLRDAVAASQRQIQSIRERLAREASAPHAYIFDAHLLMLEDPLLLDRAVAAVRDHRVNAEWALRAVADQLHAMFDELTDPYLRERSSDLDDVLGRILLNLSGTSSAPKLSHLPGSYVLVADELAPSEAAELDWDRVLAVVTDAGSATYHTSILARSFGVPAVVGLGDATRRIPPGAMVVVDGTLGQVLVEPSVPALESYREAQERHRQELRRLQDLGTLPALTSDGVRVVLRANVEFPDEAPTARQHGAEGIGLFRSEYLLGRTRDWPSEERQYEIYRHLLELMAPGPVTVRTWDVGSEDLVPGGPSSPNPALGERALRLVHRAPLAFRDQLRALLRAAAHGPLQIMFPFVAGPADLRQALALLEEARASLRGDGIAVPDHVAVGLNLEVPSAALTADMLARDVDFLSIGTNDLVQYLLAADRVDPRVSAHYQPLHPAVLRVIGDVVTAAEPHGVPVSVCGEMASDPLHALVLLG
ncbi:MAG TPA: phosphoenolpyruvate--protein phosphotransferase, partial [Vicinamibacteria bacterium]|nr:phosphoenolpyruvate--protein phosphotransferase [Vicinamibacteria bacterium]